ncbi:MAG: trimethylamine methyltransferase family protein, partial [Deltaproteobacteria bacterium]|nr:trimethylamine methyltransferase family protein [Deltaproteobacteria bacterium]
ILVPATPTDFPSNLVDMHEFRILMKNTRKHVIAEAQNGANLKKIFRMAELVAGSSDALRDRPFLSILVCLTSPLTIRADAAELIIESGRAGIPLFIEAGPMCGGTAPATLAQTLIDANAELLASFVLAKLVNPNVPIVYASWARILDMKSAGVSHGGPEFGLLRTGTTQMAKFYGLPSGGGGILADSKLIDAQFGMEKLGTALFPALARTNMIVGMGLLADENAISLEALAIDNEITGWVNRALQGIRVTEETTDISVFEPVGPGGDFLQEKHTRQNYRQEMWIPQLMERGMLVHGVDPEPKSMLQKAKSIITGLLAKFEPPTLPENIDKEFESIIRQS